MADKYACNSKLSLCCARAAFEKGKEPSLMQSCVLPFSDTCPQRLASRHKPVVATAITPAGRSADDSWEAQRSCARDVCAL